MPIARARVIINPQAGGGSAGREWPQVYNRLLQTGLKIEPEFTTRPGHARIIARKAADDGYDVLITVGGDGTVNEAVNGILESANPQKIALAIIGAGTTSSVATSLGISHDHPGVGDLLTGDHRTTVDVGVVTCQQGRGQVERFFLNEASAGIGALLLKAGNWLPNRFGRRANHNLRRLGGYGALLYYHNSRIELRLDGQLVNFRGCYVVAANGAYFADGMHIAPHARMDDGLLDVVAVGDVSRMELIRKIVPAVYKGSHAGHAKIITTQTASVGIDSHDRLPVEADGEILGTTPAVFSVRPAALTIITRAAATAGD